MTGFRKKETRTKGNLNPNNLDPIPYQGGSTVATAVRISEEIELNHGIILGASLQQPTKTSAVHRRYGKT